MVLSFTTALHTYGIWTLGYYASRTFLFVPLGLRTPGIHPSWLGDYLIHSLMVVLRTYSCMYRADDICIASYTSPITYPCHLFCAAFLHYHVLYFVFLFSWTLSSYRVLSFTLFFLRGPLLWYWSCDSRYFIYCSHIGWFRASIYQNYLAW